VHNNPINLIDPTGMSAYPPEEGTFTNGYVHTDSDGSWTFQDGAWYDSSEEGDNFLPAMVITLDKKTSKLSSDLSKAYTNSGFRHGVDWFKNNVDLGIYDFLYNNPAVTGYGSGEYGAYIPDAMGMSINASVNTGLFGSFYINAGFAVGNGKDDEFAIFGGAGADFGFNGKFGKPGGSIGGSFDFHDNYGGNTDVLRGLGGTNKSYFGGLGVTGSYSKSARLTPQGYRFEASGVSTKSIGLGLGWGGGTGVSKGYVKKFKF